MKEKQLSRRNFLRLLGYSSAATIVGGTIGSFLSGCSVSGPDVTAGTVTTEAAIEAKVISTQSGGLPADFTPDIEITLKAIETQLSILKGEPTQILKYEGEVIKGSPGVLQIIPNSYLGPIFHVERGQKLRIHFSHELPEPSVVHWHGLHVPERADGHPKSNPFFSGLINCS